MRAAPTERVAGLAFFFFTLLQIPYLSVETNLVPHGIVQLSPLQLTVANLAKTFPSHSSALQYVLVPGGWLRENLSPVLICHFRTQGKGPCTAEKARLTDLQHVIRANNLPMLVKLLETNGLAEQMPLLYGSTLIVVSAIFSLYYSVKTAVLGFLLLGYGMVMGNHAPLPPGVLTAFLCIYAGFNLGELKPNAKQRQQRKQATAAGGSSSNQQNNAVRSARNGTPAKTPSRKQHKRA